ncbi:MAG: UDP-N-acetylmuramoyl-L-alanyl-D-glutamate--2,6-diaminopimelate ligase [Clostridia bacterium]|nr:UDP-N-acetylmuramoyl-L-alanyl-D-glutamate--2,6-diaminopimelate ligase [Clostridia bacterium]
MILSELCVAAGLDCPADAGQVTVSGICTDSNQLEKGNLFVCLRGAHADGHDYLFSAADRGACAAVVAREYAGEIPEGLCILRVPSTRAAAAYLYDAWCGQPSQKMQFVGVTGTNGKTSVAWVLYGLLQYAQIPCALIGTVGCKGPGGEIPKDTSGVANMTTPEPAQLYPMLAKFAEQGTRIVVMEVTSHALVQERCAPLRFAWGIYTNLTRDHLDFHGSMAEYFAAKKKLLMQCEHVLLNADDARVASLQEQAKDAALTCSSTKKGADFYADEITVSAAQIRYRLTSANACLRIVCPMGGQFSVSNTLSAAAVALMLGVRAQSIRDGMALMQPVPGRMERIALGADVPFSVIVDYAHTPDALENLLMAARRVQMRAQRVVLVFGCGGDRDQGKRAQMGAIASRMADYFVITADNSRTEPLDHILADIVRGVDRRAHYRVMRDRRSAIRHVIEHARAGDVILLAGKGHEAYEIDQGGRHDFDERAIVREAIEDYWHT